MSTVGGQLVPAEHRVCSGLLLGLVVPFPTIPWWFPAWKVVAEHEMHEVPLHAGSQKQSKCRGENRISQWQGLSWGEQAACFLRSMHGKSIPSPLRRLLNRNKIPPVAFKNYGCFALVKRFHFYQGSCR